MFSVRATPVLWKTLLNCVMLTRTPLFYPAVIALGLVSGCSAPTPSTGLSPPVATPSAQRDTPSPGGARTGPSTALAAGVAGQRPAALLDGAAVEWSALLPALVEAAGGAVLQEHVLDTRIEAEAAARGIALAEADLAAERERIRLALAAGPGALRLGALDSDQSEQAMEAVRRARGLGERRFAALVRRNALLRWLVQADVAVDAGAVELAHAVQHGPRLRVRLITVATHAEAQAARARLADGSVDLPTRFAALARAISTDASARAGGSLGAISPADPAYPMVLRQAAEAGAAMPGGELSPVLALERGYGLLLVEERLPGTGVSIEAARTELERQARLRAEREAMDRLAADLLARPGLTIFDRALERSWREALPARR